jgi:hypothetical protein
MSKFPLPAPFEESPQWRVFTHTSDNYSPSRFVFVYVPFSMNIGLL